MTTIATNDHALAHIIDRTPFANRGHSLWSEWTSLPGTGEAPDSVVDALVVATEGHTKALYIVYSYSTPIAWARQDDRLLTVPHVRYSTTTSQHQYTCLGAGQRVTMGDPGQVRKGRGKTPYTARGGW